jgi:hypothetical protein
MTSSPLAPFAPLRESLRLIRYFAFFAFFAAKFPIRIISHYVTFVPFVVSCLLRLRRSRAGPFVVKLYSDENTANRFSL